MACGRGRVTAAPAVVRRLGAWMLLRAVQDGFLGLGDAITPGGQMGIVPAMCTGRRAAEVAAQAMRAGNTPAQGPAAYDRLLHGAFLGLTSTSNVEMDRVCQTCGRLDLAPFFFGEPWPMH